MAFDLEASVARAERRLASPVRARRKTRSDLGSTRLPGELARLLTRYANQQERPAMKEVLESLAATADRHGLRMPSRTTVYRFFDVAVPSGLRTDTLPPAVSDALYNLDGTARIPAPQVVFYCFNYGTPRAMSFAAGLPWLALHQARRIRGWRSRSRALLEAVTRNRGI